MQVCCEHFINVSNALEHTGDRRALSAPTHYLQNQDPLNENVCFIICWWPAPDIAQTGPSMNVFAFAGTVWIYEASVDQPYVSGTSKPYIVGR